MLVITQYIHACPLLTLPRATPAEECARPSEHTQSGLPLLPPGPVQLGSSGAVLIIGSPAIASPTASYTSMQLGARDVLLSTGLGSAQGPMPGTGPAAANLGLSTGGGAWTGRATSHTSRPDGQSGTNYEDSPLVLTTCPEGFAGAGGTVGAGTRGLATSGPLHQIRQTSGANSVPLQLLVSGTAGTQQYEALGLQFGRRDSGAQNTGGSDSPAGLSGLGTGPGSQAAGAGAGPVLNAGPGRFSSAGREWYGIASTASGAAGAAGSSAAAGLPGGPSAGGSARSAFIGNPRMAALGERARSGPVQPSTLRALSKRPSVHFAPSVMDPAEDSGTGPGSNVSGVQGPGSTGSGVGAASASGGTGGGGAGGAGGGGAGSGRGEAAGSSVSGPLKFYGGGLQALLGARSPGMNSRHSYCGAYGALGGGTGTVGAGGAGGSGLQWGSSGSPGGATAGSSAAAAAAAGMGPRFGSMGGGYGRGAGPGSGMTAPSGRSSCSSSRRSRLSVSSTDFEGGSHRTSHTASCDLMSARERLAMHHKRSVELPPGVAWAAGASNSGLGMLGEEAGGGSAGPGSARSLRMWRSMPHERVREPEEMELESVGESKAEGASGSSSSSGGSKSGAASRTGGRHGSRGRRRAEGEVDGDGESVEYDQGQALGGSAFAAAGAGAAGAGSSGLLVTTGSGGRQWAHAASGGMLVLGSVQEERASSSSVRPSRQEGGSGAGRASGAGGVGAPLSPSGSMGGGGPGLGGMRTSTRSSSSSSSGGKRMSGGRTSWGRATGPASGLSQADTEDTDDDPGVFDLRALTLT